MGTFTVTAESVVKIVQNGAAMELHLADSSGKPAVLLLKMPQVKGLSTNGRSALYDKWLHTFRNAIEMAQTAPQTSSSEDGTTDTKAAHSTQKPTTTKLSCGKYGTYFPSKKATVSTQLKHSPEIQKPGAALKPYALAFLLLCGLLYLHLRWLHNNK